MTVRELIKKLNKVDKDLPVLIGRVYLDSDGTLHDVGSSDSVYDLGSHIAIVEEI